MTNILTIQRDLNDKLPAYAWPGGYPIYYLTPQGEAMCPTCATGEFDQWCDADWRGPYYVSLLSQIDDLYDGPQYADINYEDEHLYCVQCDDRIPSAYGEDD